jgi:hypothetical protein
MQIILLDKRLPASCFRIKHHMTQIKPTRLLPTPSFQVVEMGFTVFNQGQNRETSPIDLDAFVDYLKTLQKPLPIVLITEFKRFNIRNKAK